jgi:hypothetical protein
MPNPPDDTNVLLASGPPGHSSTRKPLGIAPREVPQKISRSQHAGLPRIAGMARHTLCPTRWRAAGKASGELVIRSRRA